jgi:hypothetical protein
VITFSPNSWEEFIPFSFTDTKVPAAKNVARVTITAATERMVIFIIVFCFELFYGQGKTKSLRQKEKWLREMKF